MIAENGQATWDFSDTRPGTYTAVVRVTDQAGRSGEASVSVIVRSKPLGLRNERRETGRSLLLADSVEAKGFGLYSYVLFGSKPTEASRDRYLQAIIEFLKFPAISEMVRYRAARELNITYIPTTGPMTKEVTDAISQERYDVAGSWVLQHYDYARARAMLSRLPREHRDGPYVISLLTPFDIKGTLARPYLFQDQSLIPPRLVALWVREFLQQAAQERFWEKRSLQHMVLRIRTAVGVLSEGLSDVRKSLAGWTELVS